MIVNRSTDFFWRAGAFAALGGLYVSPNPFTCAVRSDKGAHGTALLPDRDEALGVEPEERRILDDHVPETHVVKEENVDMLAERKADFVFKPRRAFAGRGVLDTAVVGRARLRRLAKGGDGYVAQRRVTKGVTQTGNENLWTDLRVWAYRGEIVLLSGRAPRRADRIDLAPPGGWLPTFSSG